MASNERGGVSPEAVAVGAVLTAVAALVWFLWYLFTPKCYWVSVECRGPQPDAQYHIRRQAPTMPAAVEVAQRLMEMRPEGSVITGVSINGEGRSWFCEK